MGVRTMFRYTLAFLLLVNVTSADFVLLYPEWRGNSYDAPASQRIGPCAGIPTLENSVRSLWPLNGGAVSINQNTPQFILHVKLGLGNNVTNFNYTFTPNPLNVTGRGVICLPELKLPQGALIQEGTNATIQVINLAPNGTALYNCADIKFSADALPVYAHACTNATGISALPVEANATNIITSEIPQSSVPTSSAPSGSGPASSSTTSITSPQDSLSSTGPNTSPNGDNRSSSNLPTALGAGLGIPLGLLAIGLLAFFVWREKRKEKVAGSTSAHENTTYGLGSRHELKAESTHDGQQTHQNQQELPAAQYQTHQLEGDRVHEMEASNR